jgi:membrane-bound serine protease (ClpP class)
VTGVICLTLAFFSLQVLPLNAVGLTLLVVGLLMMSLDHLLAGHGFLAVGGGICFAAGSFFLLDRVDPALRVSLPLIFGALAAAGLFSAFVLKAAWGTRGMAPATGREALIGRIGEVRPGGLIFLDGQLWTAEGVVTSSTGTKVRVVDVSGNKLLVENV